MNDPQRHLANVSSEAGPGPAYRETSASAAGEQGLLEQISSLRHQIALRDEFLSTAAHELRNPLSPAYMQLEHMKEIVRTSPAPVSQSWLMTQLESMTVRFDRFLETLNRLLDASRLGAGHLVLIPEPCDLVQVIQTVLGSAQRELQAARCVVKLNAPAAVTGCWDRLRLEQIFGNLLSNATRYGAGSEIAIDVSADDTAVRLQVMDRGIGIAPEDLPRIFQRFERARNVGRNTGFGIGLWIVSELCRAMGGRIDVHSELGKGATFTVALPRKA